MHHFGDHPPPRVLTLTRGNGDRLIWDPKANLFAVYTREGAPRTIMNPRDGMACWNEQKAREAEGGDYHARSHRNYGRSDGGGYGGGGEEG